MGPWNVLCSGCWLCGFGAFLRTAPTRWHQKDVVVLCDDRHVLRRIAPTHRYPPNPTRTAPLQLYSRFTCKPRGLHHSAPRSSLPCICHYLQGLMIGAKRHMTPKSEQRQGGCNISSKMSDGTRLFAVLLLLMFSNGFLSSVSCLCYGTTLAMLAEDHSHQVQRWSYACQVDRDGTPKSQF